ncbi:tyrosine-type recombinase/integrase [Lactobacillus sp. Sy-1]|uniref:tyrosine-type recombinase/integrase n=1 Tax=Lactobacillus sp. Sy-1 TaxID=2109645 RepID=UPI001C5774CE|nr:tyrosine-type recombinase/integrase [Lactobacillus sp. Sy-1]MBW1605575.1 tyrosine-type recombinase/integrase [Lactobacillus sp. Sy-1]
MAEEKVYPIKDDQTLIDVEDTLMHNFAKSGHRNYMIFQLGKATLLRCSDVMKLKYLDAFDDDGILKDSSYIHDQKTGKQNRLYLKPVANDLLRYQQWRQKMLRSRHQTSEWLFPSIMYPERHITVNQFYKIMQRTGELLGIDYLGTHTMRKTGAYRLYEQTNHNIALVMQSLNHSSEAMTLHYLGLDEITKRNIFDTIDFG